MFSAEEILDIAVKIEENGEEFYIKLAEAAKNSSRSIHIVNLARKLAEEENKHRTRFLEIKRSLLSGKSMDILKKVSSILTQEAIGDRLFSFTPRKIEEINSLEEMINVAIELEKESIKFYEILKLLATDNKAVEIIDKIIEEENKHVSTLYSIESTFPRAPGGRE